jgi:hypothetical protein
LRQSRAIRTAYRRLAEGISQRELYRTLRAHPTGQGFHTWLLLSGISKAKALHKLRPDGKVVFGGRKRLIERSQGKIGAGDWKDFRLMPLVIEGHARSYGPQGGNHLVSLDAAGRCLTYHASSKDFVLNLRISGRSRSYLKRLQALQARCESHRDTPFSVSIREKEVCLTWDIPSGSTQFGMNPDRVLALDLNPNRIGWAVVNREGQAQCRCVAWGIFEYPQLNRGLGVCSQDPRAIALHNKRGHELAILAKRLVEIALHHKAGTVATERLTIEAKNHRVGRRFNRLVNNGWFRNGFLRPLRRRIADIGLRHQELNPAYSSLIGNAFWADALQVPDPACAALELGRRQLHPLLFRQESPVPLPLNNVDRQRKDGRRAPEKSGAFSEWARVWRNLKPMVRDTPCQIRRRLPDSLRFGSPRRHSIQEQRSLVSLLDPRPGTSEPFGFDFNLLFAD